MARSQKYIEEETSTILLAKHLIPTPTEMSTKAQCKVAIFGGSEGSVGGPYFAALSSLKVGISTVHIFCEKDVVAVISAFDPELCIHGILDNANFKSLITNWLDCNVFIIGPGLSNKTVVLANVTKLIQTLKKDERPVVLCGEGLLAILSTPNLLGGYKHAIIIMNNKEFQHTYMPDESKPEILSSLKITSIGNTLLDLPATIVRIDKHDIIFNKNAEAVCSSPLIMKITDPHGEMLSGTLGVFFYWGCLKETEADLTTVALTACYAACKLSRECNVRAFKKHGRATMRKNIIDEIGNAFCTLFETK